MPIVYIGLTMVLGMQQMQILLLGKFSGSMVGKTYGYLTNCMQNCSKFFFKRYQNTILI